MNEHYCPICRRELLTNDHGSDCPIGQTSIGQAHRLGLLMGHAFDESVAAFYRNYSRLLEAFWSAL